MNISRWHFLMIAAISLFTGIIAPSVTNHNFSLPYALTNMQYVAYFILFWLIILFILAFLRMRKLSYIFIAILITMVISLAVMTIAGMVKSFSGDILQNFSWGWIFLLIGLFFLFLTFLKDEETKKSDQNIHISRFYEKILGITGAIVLIILTIFVIFIAEKNAAKNTKTGILGNIFASGSLQHKHWQTLSPAFKEIKNISFDRGKNFLSFLAIDENDIMLSYPDKTEIKNPNHLASVHHFGQRTFFVQKDGSVIENGKRVGEISTDGITENFFVFHDDNNLLHIITHDGSQTFESVDKTAALFTYDSKTQNIYWRAKTGDFYKIFKNGKPLSEAYHQILRYTISDDESLLLITENADWSKFVVKNHTIVHKIKETYIPWSIRMNNADVLYIIKNADDSFSIVLNGVILERKLDEIREIFIEQNTSWFSYFGRPQWESRYCLFTRYKGNLCSIESYMNPHLEGDNSAIAFAALREWKWSIYRNTTAIIKQSGYKNRNDISLDYFFFDRTNIRHYIFIEKVENGYIINKMWKIIDGIWEDIDVNSIYFDYNTMFASVKDASGWRILEF